MAPFVWLLPWTTYSAVYVCKLTGADELLGPNVVRRRYALACPGSLALPGGLAIADPAPALSVLFGWAVPLTFVFLFFGCRSQLIALKVKDSLWKLQVLALDVLDVGGLAAQALLPDVFVYLQLSAPVFWSLLAVLPIALLSSLFQAAVAFQLVDLGHSSFGTPRRCSFLTLISLDLPVLAIRAALLGQTTSVLQSVFVLKSFVCCFHKVGVVIAGSHDNRCSSFISQMVGMLPGQDNQARAFAAEIFADSGEDLEEKLEDLSRLIELQQSAAKIASFQRAILTAQANILSGVAALDANALKEGFEAFDANRDGRLSRDEVQLMMKTVANIVDEREIDRFIGETDTDLDGTIDYQEFATKFVRDPKVRARVIRSGPKVASRWRWWSTS